MKKYPTYRSASWVYLVILLTSPIIGLMWHLHWGWLKANWIAYPFMAVAILQAMRTSKKEPRSFVIALVVFTFYAFYFFWHGGEWESLIRLFVALVPLFLLWPIRQNISHAMFRKFHIAYLVVLLVPISISALQLSGYFPFYDFGTAYGLYDGRISGGYLKPNNLCAVLFPAFLYGFYLFYKGQNKIGLALAALVFLIVVTSGLRTSVIAYGSIFVLAFFPRVGNAIMFRGFKYGIFAAIAIVSFVSLSFARDTFGLTDGLRKRLPMWMAHAENFFQSSPMEIILGEGVVQLPAEAAKLGVASLSEVHNNEFRVMITFGIAGYLLYALFLRGIAFQIQKSGVSEKFKFLQSASLIYLLLYSITNEPTFYPAIFWPVTAWIFFTNGLRQSQS